MAAGALWVMARKKPVCVYAIHMAEPFTVETLEGTMRGNAGDWLIKGVNGELYPSKPDIFAKTYDVLDYGEETR
jgi:hypothetical protein